MYLICLTYTTLGLAVASTFAGWLVAATWTTLRMDRIRRPRPFDYRGDIAISDHKEHV
jgi:hypothetical protein